MPRRKKGIVQDALVPLVAGSALTAALVLALAPPGTWIDQAPTAQKGSPEVADEVVLEVARPPDRNVTPLGVTSIPARDGPLRRIPPRNAEAGTGVETVMDLSAEVVYRRPIVVEAGRFRAVVDDKPIVVAVAGIRPLAFDAICTDDTGKSWKCGPRGRAELARMVSGRNIACRIVDETDPLAPVGDCRVGLRSIAPWLVENGWAEPDGSGDPSLAGLAEVARAEGRGRWMPAPDA